ncbi:hypothetical protein C0584_01080 [Candidatus Parcubacteria bacterium]|nr:MAG: hypothetical protein C0584_01080 [Candidatus Parcubacteria bacterium]
MNTLKNKKYFLILGKFNTSIAMLLLFVGVFLFPKTAYLSSISPEKIVELSNKERIEKDLDPLSVNQHLSKAAYDKAEAIFSEQRFEHNFDDRKFSAWVKDVGYEYRYVGENLGINFVTSEGLMQAWKDSPTHYKNIINEKFSEIGVAVLEDSYEGRNSILVVQVFAKPLLVEPSISEISVLNFNQNLSQDINNIYSLSHTQNTVLENKFNNNNYYVLNSTDNILPVDNKKDQKYLDLLFTFFGFIYLFIFKLVSIKNIGF